MSDAKPFEATQGRLERARREGDLLRSSELNAVAALAGGSAALVLALDPLAVAARAALVHAARGDNGLPAYGALALLALSVPGAALAGAIVATTLAAGSLAFTFPVPKLERLAPQQGLKRMLSRDAAVGAAKALGASAAVAFVLVPVVRDSLLGTSAATPAALASRTLGAIERCFGAALVAGSAFAWLDLMLERAKRRRRLRMSFEEMRRDQKQSEGDPALRGRRRRAHRALARGSLQRLPEAAFVIANPNHIALGLAYHPPAIAVPQVLVRAADAAALRVKARACELGIPVVEDIALARSLFASTGPGEFIPRDAYVPVAAIVAALIRQKRLAP